MSDKIGIVILAAGQGTRLKMDVAKPLAPISGKTLIDFPIKEGFKFLENNKLKGDIGIVIGHQKELVQSYVEESYKDKIHFAVQKEQNGTADALKAYFENCSFAKESMYTLVMCADTPVLSEEELSSLYKILSVKTLSGVAATFTAEKPKGYGRIIRGNPGFKIVEEKDANEEQRKITEVNSGLYFLNTQFILDHLYNLTSDNKAGEFYLTDLFQENFGVEAVHFEDDIPFLGINTLEQLESAQGHLYRRKAWSLRDEGVRFIDSKAVFIDDDVQVSKGTTIYPNVYLQGNTQIGSDCIVEPGCFLKDSIVENNVQLKAYTHLEKTLVKSECAIGPFARLRPETEVGKGTKIGNFVETKKAKLGEKVGLSHLSYVGDAEVGDNTNIGCGFITCNYDGGGKHKTVIGKNTFIGSDTQVIAPLEIGDSAYVASGSTINQNIPSEGFAIARGRQTTKEGMARRFLKGKWAIKK